MTGGNPDVMFFRQQCAMQHCRCLIWYSRCQDQAFSAAAAVVQMAQLLSNFYEQLRHIGIIQSSSLKG